MGLYRDWRSLEGRYQKKDHLEPFSLDGGLLKYIYATPDFVMGSWMMEKLEASKWVNMSSQNRWQGILFNGDSNSRIFPQAVGLGNGKTYNQFWSVQKGPVALVGKLPGPDFSWQSGDVRIFFSSDLQIEEQQGWIFAEAKHAYAAVGYSSTTEGVWDDQNWFRMPNSNVPLIFEVGRKKDYGSLKEFSSAVLSALRREANQTLRYIGQNQVELQLPFGGENRPMIDGKPLNVWRQGDAFRSRYLNADWGDGTGVTIQTNNQQWSLRPAG